MSSLTCKFTESCKQPDGEALAKIRDHFLADIIMNEKYSSSSSSINIPQVDAIVAFKDRKKLEEYAKYIATALKILNERLDALEDKLIDKYGEYFAATLAVDHLDDETYKHIMTIQNDEDRRQEFAKALNEGLENGTIEKDAFDDNPEFKEWLEVRKEEELHLIIEKQNNLELANSISTEQKISNAHSISDGNEEDAFNSIFENKKSI